MEFGLLGPLVAGDGGSRVTVTAGKQRVVLAALLLRANQVVSFADLAEAVWQGSPPGTARVTLQNYVKRLRQALGPAGYERIVTSPAGYLIKVGAAELDLLRFTELMAAGRAAAAAGDWGQASRQLAAGLSLWRGRPLADVPSPVLAAQAGRLARMRLDAVEARIDADLHLGRHREVAGELESLVAAEPLRERLAELLMLALYRSGQQAAALAAYRQARRRLVAELGIEPGPGLRELNQRILRSDRGLLLPAAGGEPRKRPAAGGGAARARPRMLPADVAGFTGRTAELDALSAAIPGAAGRPVVITAIGGTAGVGKTALAVHWARQHAAGFPGGQLYVNLRGFGPGDPVPPTAALRRFLEALQVPAGQIPAGLEGRQALYRSQLDGQRILVVLDNAADPDQVRPLLPATPQALVLVTSRSDLASLAVTDGAAQVPLDVLTAAEARQLLAARLGAGRVAGEPEAAAELTGLCARLPLALAITAARAAAHPSFPLAALAAELRDERTRLDVLSTGDDATDVRAVLSWSYRGLGGPPARMFRLLGLHPGPDITAAAAASLAGTSAAEARLLLRELARCHLLAEPVPGRFAFHDLLRAYAAERAAATETEMDRQAATARVLDHYLHTARAARLLLYAPHDPVTLAPPGTGVMPEFLAGHQQARDWFDAEQQVLFAMVSLAERSGFDAHAWQLPWAMYSSLDRRSQWHEMAAVLGTALDAATRLGDTAGQAAIRTLLAHACCGLGDYGKARSYLADCLRLYRQLGDAAGEAWARQSSGMVSDRQGRYADALRQSELALGLFRAVGHKPGQASALNSIGWCHGLLGDHQQARAYCRQAVDLCREIGNRYGEGHTWDSLGYAELHLGHYPEAVACYARAVELLGEIGDRTGEAHALDHLGDAQLGAGDPGAARDAWQQALAILDDLRHPDAGQVRDKLRRLP